MKHLRLTCRTFRQMVFAAVFLTTFLACKTKQPSPETSPLQFEQSKWMERNEKSYTYRDRMLNDLLASDTLKKLKQRQVLSLLGPPTRSDSAYLFYLVDQTLLGDVFPLHTKTLVIKFNNDSTVQWCKIHQ